MVQNKVTMKTLKRLLQVTFVTNFILLVTLIVLVVLNLRKQQQQQSSKAENAKFSGLLEGIPADSGVCTKCDHLGQNIQAEDTLYDSILDRKGHRLCCTKQPEYLPSLVRMMVQSEDQRLSDSLAHEKIYKDLAWWRNRPNSIHLFLDQDKLKEHKFVWRFDNDDLGVGYNKGFTLNTTANSLIVPGPHRAKYFVYAAISYDFKDIESVPVFYHNVTKTHMLLPNTVETLLMTKYGGSPELERNYTSFVCGVFEIQQEFNIKTEVSLHDYISPSKYASYFGMFRL